MYRELLPTSGKEVALGKNCNIQSSRHDLERLRCSGDNVFIAPNSTLC